MCSHTPCRSSSAIHHNWFYLATQGECHRLHWQANKRNSHILLFLHQRTTSKFCGRFPPSEQGEAGIANAGCVCAGARLTKRDDHIAIFLGASVLFVVRELTAGNRSERDIFASRLISDEYVNQTMEAGILNSDRLFHRIFFYIASVRQRRGVKKL